MLVLAGSYLIGFIISALDLEENANVYILVQKLDLYLEVLTLQQIYRIIFEFNPCNISEFRSHQNNCDLEHDTNIWLFWHKPTCASSECRKHVAKHICAFMGAGITGTKVCASLPALDPKLILLAIHVTS